MERSGFQPYREEEPGTSYEDPGGSGEADDAFASVLTHPCEPVANEGHDNANSDLILRVNDVIVGQLGARYRVLDVLGQGTFGQVVRCVCDATGGQVAIKVIKNQPAYYQQARMEISILNLLNSQYDPEAKHHVVRMLDFCKHRNHLCIVFELLSYNLFELLKHNRFHGLSLTLVRVLVSQILSALVLLRDAGVIHCDLKPENILLQELDSGCVKVIDFGSACFEQHTIYSYIQSRFYRSIEVVLGYPYSVAIDMWSLGCIAAELFLGLPLFPGASEFDLLTRITDMLGTPPDNILRYSKNAHKYFNAKTKPTSAEQPQGTHLGLGSPAQQRQRHRRATAPPLGAGMGGGMVAGLGPSAVPSLPIEDISYELKTEDEFERSGEGSTKAGKCYFKHTKLADIVHAYPTKAQTEEEVAAERAHRDAFLSFLGGLLAVDPHKRWTPRQALSHPFVTGSGACEGWQPPPDPTPALSPYSMQMGMGLQAMHLQHAAELQRRRAQSDGSASGGSSGTAFFDPAIAHGGAAGADPSQVHAHAAAMAAYHAALSQQQQQQQQTQAQTQMRAGVGVGMGRGETAKGASLGGQAMGVQGSGGGAGGYVHAGGYGPMAPVPMPAGAHHTYGSKGEGMSAGSLGSVMGGFVPHAQAGQAAFHHGHTVHGGGHSMTAVGIMQVNNQDPARSHTFFPSGSAP